MRHVDEGQLHAYLDGATDAFGPGEFESIERHLSECESCRTRLDAERDIWARAGALFGDELGAGAAQVPPYEEVFRDTSPTPVRRVARGWIVLPWAATVVLALGIGWMVSANEGSERGESLALESAEADAAHHVDVATAESVLQSGRTSGVPSSAAEPRETRDVPATDRVASAEPASPPAAVAAADAIVADASSEEPVLAGRSAPPSAPTMYEHPAAVAATAMAAQSRAVTGRAQGGETAENVVVRGVVTEQGGQPLAGATVQVEGSQIGVTTGVDGTYSLTIPGSLFDSASVWTLRVALVGYEADRRRLDGTAERLETQDFTLQAVPAPLESLVVVGYRAPAFSLGDVRDEQVRAEQQLGRALPLIPALPVVGINRQSVHGDGRIVVRQRLADGKIVELQVSVPESAEYPSEVSGGEPVEELKTREQREGAAVELRVRGMTVTITGPVPLAELREIASRIR